MQGVLSRASFRRPPLQRPKDFYGVVSTYKQYLHQKNGVLQKKVILTVRAIMMGQQIDMVAGDFNGRAWRHSKRDNMSTIDEAFANCAFQRRRALHFCGDPDRFQTTGLTYVGSLNCLIQISIGRCACMVLPPSHAKLSACVQPIKAAIMRHGSIWISSIGAALNHIMKSMTDEFSSRNVRRHVPMGNENTYQ